MKDSKSSRKWEAEDGLVIGLDLGDQKSQVCVFGADLKIRHEDQVRTTTVTLSAWFGRLPPALVVLEVGTHSPWISRLLKSLGHRAMVVDARKLKVISESTSKNDRRDARVLGELGASVPHLLGCVEHRSEAAQQHLGMIRGRSQLVRARTGLWNNLRGLAKSQGRRLPSKVTASVIEEMVPGLEPLRKTIEAINQQVKQYDQQLTIVAQEYPAVERLTEIHGVGTLIALTFVLTIDDPKRLKKSRMAGGLVGLRPKQRDSGNQSPQLGITKTGDRYLRTLLVQGAQYVLSRNGEDCDLKRWGLQLCARGGKNAKKRAVVAVARKLAVLLHKLWVSGEPYRKFMVPVEAAEAKAS
jgi:transposase